MTKLFARLGEMTMRQGILITAIAVTAVVGWYSSKLTSPPTAAPPPILAVAAAPADLNALIAEKGRAKFLSHDGKWVGKDTDAEIHLLRDGTVHLTRYGIVVHRYIGTYRIDDKGRIETTFKDTEWPPMLLKRDSKSLLLEFAEREQWFGKPFRAFDKM